MVKQMKRCTFLFLILFCITLVKAQNKVTVGILSDVPLKSKTQLLIDLKEEITIRISNHEKYFIRNKIK